MTYPLHVLATNRICETVVSRRRTAPTAQGGNRMLQDFSTIRNISGLFIGLVPYCIAYAYSSFIYKKYVKTDGLYLKDSSSILGIDKGVIRELKQIRNQALEFAGVNPHR